MQHAHAHVARMHKRAYMPCFMLAAARIHVRVRDTRAHITVTCYSYACFVHVYNVYVL
jgi:hypothetical protein